MDAPGTVEVIDYPQQASRDTASVATFAQEHDADAVRLIHTP
jgi:hypothetical protein